MQSTNGATAGSGDDPEQSFSLAQSVLLILVFGKSDLERGSRSNTVENFTFEQPEKCQCNFAKYLAELFARYFVGVKTSSTFVAFGITL